MCIRDSVNTTVILNRFTFEAETAMWGQSTLTGQEVDDICCWCPCSTEVTYGPWVLLSTYIVGNAKHCEYMATQTTTRRCFGHYLTDCNGCNTSRVISTTNAYATATVLPTESCPQYGGSGTPTGNPPGPYTY